MMIWQNILLYEYQEVYLDFKYILHFMGQKLFYMQSFPYIYLCHLMPKVPAIRRLKLVWKQSFQKSISMLGLLFMRVASQFFFISSVGLVFYNNHFFLSFTLFRIFDYFDILVHFWKD